MTARNVTCVDGRPRRDGTSERALSRKRVKRIIRELRVLPGHPIVVECHRCGLVISATRVTIDFALVCVCDPR